MTQLMDDALARRFEDNRTRLKAVAYRMLGSASEAEDAVQETWLRLSRSDADAIDNLSGWLTTVVGRVCLDLLRSRESRREAAWELDVPDTVESITQERADPEQEALLADSVGLALLVVLETLDPAERLAFVLHDMFALPFDEIAPIVGRSTAAARQLASRARRRVQGADPAGDRQPDLARRGEVVQAFLAAARDGDFEALLSVLDPDVLLLSDGTAVRKGSPGEVRGATAVAGFYLGRAQAVRPALVDGGLAGVWADQEQLRIVLAFTVVGERITAIEVVADPDRLERCTVAYLDE